MVKRRPFKTDNPAIKNLRNCSAPIIVTLNVFPRTKNPQFYNIIREGLYVFPCVSEFPILTSFGSSKKTTTTAASIWADRSTFGIQWTIGNGDYWKQPPNRAAEHAVNGHRTFCRWSVWLISGLFNMRLAFRVCASDIPAWHHLEGGRLFSPAMETWRTLPPVPGEGL